LGLSLGLKLSPTGFIILGKLGWLGLLRKWAPLEKEFGNGGGASIIFFFPPKFFFFFQKILLYFLFIFSTFSPFALLFLKRVFGAKPFVCLFLGAKRGG